MNKPKILTTVQHRELRWRNHTAFGICVKYVDFHTLITKTKKAGDNCNVIDVLIASHYSYLLTPIYKIRLYSLHTQDKFKFEELQIEMKRDLHIFQRICEILSFISSGR